MARESYAGDITELGMQVDLQTISQMSEAKDNTTHDNASKEQTRRCLDKVVNYKIETGAACWPLSTLRSGRVLMR